MTPLALEQLAIAFPNIDPVLFQVGPFAIRWYSLSYIVGILLGWWYARRLVSNERLWRARAPISPVDLDDFVLWATVGTVLGGRLGYVFFYSFDAFLAEPSSIIRVWEGGMSFHGGFLGVTLAMILFAMKNKIPVWSLFDIIAAVVPIGIGLGRLANFINGELWGRASDVPWAIQFPSGGFVARHPSQLYEAALEGLVLLIIMAIAIYRHGVLRKPRFVTGLFVSGYGMARTFVEFFREPDAHIGYLLGDWLTMGMVLSAPMIIIGIALILSAREVTFYDQDEELNDAT